MARAHVEFVQSQNVAWEGLPGGCEIKRLSEDASSAERAALIRCPAGWSGTTGETGAEEFYVLDGAIEIGGEHYGRNYYGFLPEEAAELARTSAAGALILSFRFAEGDPAARSGPSRIDTAAMPWDMATLDPALTHLRLARKILRLGANEGGRTYLLAGLPHGFPLAEDMAVERHPHSEEMFLIHGEMKAPEGIMTTGAYFFRPPRIDHGPHISEFGFLMLMRNPGSSRVITEWIEDRRPLPFDAPFIPTLPEGTPASWNEPRPVRPIY